MNMTKAGLIPNVPTPPSTLVVCLRQLIVVAACLLSVTGRAAVDDWPVTISSTPADPLEAYLNASGHEAVLTFGCNSLIQVSLDQNGIGVVTATMIVLDPEYDLDLYIVDIMGPLTDTVTCAQIGEEVMVVVEDPEGNFCMSQLIVEDKLKPVLQCSDDTIPCYLDPLDLDFLEYLDTVYDNCDEDPFVYFTPVFTDLDCDPSGFAGYVDVVYTAVDDYGNTRQCEKRIYLEKFPVDSVDFPADTVLNCDGADTDPAITGSPTIDGQPISHVCDLFAWKTDQLIPMCSGKYKIRRQWWVMDWCTGDQETDIQFILVTDTIPPVITCPVDDTIGTSALLCSATYTFPSPGVTDICSDDALIDLWFTTNTIPGIFLPGQQLVLPLGPHIITVRATDDCNNPASCQYTVTVVDDDDPSVACNNVNVTLNNMGMAFLYASSTAFNATDNCGVVSRRIRRMDDNCNTPENLVFDQEVKFCCADVADTVMVIFEAMDAAGNVTICMIQVDVKDGEDPVALCRDACVFVGQDGTVTLSADSIDNGSTDNCEIVDRVLSDSIFTCADIDAPVEIILTVTDAEGNTGTCTALVTVKDTVPPMAVCRDITIELGTGGDTIGMATITVNMINNGSSDNCTIDTMYLSRYVFDCSDVGDTTVMLIVIDESGNADTCTANVTVEEMPPMVICMDITVYLDENGYIVITPDSVDAVSDDCTMMPDRMVFPDTVTCADIGDVVVTLIATDGAGLMDTCTAIVTVVDTLSPVCEIVADFTVYLDSDGEVTLDSNALDDGSTDNCFVTSITIDPDTFTCADTDASVLVVQTVTDQSGNSSTCSVLVTVEDTIAPVCQTIDITVFLGADGMVTIDSSALDNGSSDNCEIDSIALSQVLFECDDIDSVVVTQTVTDISGNSSTCTATVTVADTLAPVCQTIDITVFLGMDGTFEIDSNALDNGSSDNCEIDSIALSQVLFECDDIDSVVVTQTVTDISGNSSTCTATVTVVDTLPPVCLTDTITVELGPDGTFVIDSNAVDDGSFDNCAIMMIEVSPDTFNCSSPDTVIVVQTVTDVNGNSSTCTALVIVLGGEAPQAVCTDITVFLDEDGMVTITGMDVDGGSSSICGDLMLSVDPATFDCEDVGDQQVILTVIDVTGAMDTCTATVTVMDTLDPICLTQDITVYLDEDGTFMIDSNAVDNGSSDNCEIEEFVLSQVLFDCDDITVEVVQTVTDVNGNSSTCTAVVTVMDTLDPICLTQDITVQLIDGSVTITGDDIDDGSSDNCDSVALTVEPSMFDCDSLGEHIVILTVTDGSGNSTTCTATVTVEDPGELEASCQDLEVFIGPNGQVIIHAVDVNFGSTGSCSGGDLTFMLSDSVFFCSDLGDNVVTLIVTDEMGNMATCTATINVDDNTPPTIDCPDDMTVDCDVPINLGNLGAQFGNPVVNDNCPPVDLDEDVDDNRNDCGSGTIVRTFLATDPSGNTAQCVQTITIEDEDPFDLGNIFWPPGVVNLSQCNSTDPGPGNQPVIDAGTCSGISVDYDDDVVMNIDNDPLTPCLVITRMWTVTDTCQIDAVFMFTQMIFLNDNIGPIFSPVLNDVTVSADTTTCDRFVPLVTSATDCGITTTVTNDLNGGGGNASAIFPIGETTVIFSSTDACGNISTMDVVVTVLDPDPPIIMCEKIIRTLEDCDVFVLAEEFIAFTPGSCSDIGDFIFSYSPTDPLDSGMLFMCGQVGVEPVFIYTFDLDGFPVDTCLAQLDLRLGMNNMCCGINGLGASGEIYTPASHMMDHVPVLISEPSMQTVMTDDHGRYLYLNLEMGGDYVLTPFLDARHKQGVSTLDLVAMQKHLLGIKRLNSPYQLIAADVNNSQTVTALDMVEVRKLLLNIIPAFRHNTSWRFVAADFDFPDPDNPWVIPFPETIELDSVTQPMMHNDFVGVKVGDVNQSAFNLGTGGIAVRSGEALRLVIGDRVIQAGEEIEVPVTVAGYRDILGYQFTIQYNPEMAEFRGVSLPKGSFLSDDWFGLSHVVDGIVSTLWHEAGAKDIPDGETLFSIRLRSHRTMRLSDLFSLYQKGLAPEAYSENGDMIMPVQLSVGQIAGSEDFALYQNVPNPFSDGTIIPVQIPHAGQVVLEVYSAEGRLVLRKERAADRGYFEFTVDEDELPGGGVYYYTVATDHFKGTRKMILLE